MSWYLKKNDGQVFGPVEDEVALQWAREGRILPEDLISSDRMEWAAPSSVAALGLEWYIPSEDGTPFGPIHALALSDLVREGALGMDDTIAHKTTREIRRVCEVLVPALLHYSASLRDTLAAEQAGAEKLASERAAHDEGVLQFTRKMVEEEASSKQSEAVAHQRIRELQETIGAMEASRKVTDENAKGGDRIRDELREIAQVSEQREKEILRLKKSLDAETAAAKKRDAEARQKLAALQETELRLMREIETARDHAAHAERKHERSLGGGDYKSLVQSYDDLHRNYDLLMQQFTTKTADLADANAACETLKKESDERVARLEETIRREREDADKARQRLVKAEESHLELVRSYRELNDRHIRYRQKMEAPAGHTAHDNSAATESKPKVRLV